MPLFEVEQYEVHVRKYEVDAGTEAEAISRVLAGDEVPEKLATEFVDVLEERGMSLHEDLGLTVELSELGVRIDERLRVPSIRSVERMS